MGIGDYFGNTSDNLSNLNQQFIGENNGVVTRFEFYQEQVPLNDSGLRVFTRNLGSSMVLGSRQRGGLNGYAAYKSGFGNSMLILPADGNTSDISSNNFTITTSGTAAYHNNIHISGAFLFNGSQNFYLGFPLAAINFSEGTFECWYSPRITAHNLDKVLVWAGGNGFGGGGTAAPEMSIYIDENGTNGNPSFQITISGAYIVNLKDTTTNLASGTKLHIAGTWAGSGNYAYLYVNGAPKASGLQLSAFDGSGFIFLGRVGAPGRLTNPNSTACGDVDEVRISNKARQPHELNYLKTYLGDSTGAYSAVTVGSLII